MLNEPEVNFEPLGVKIWNYGLKAADYIPDPAQREVIDKFMNANIRHKRPVTDMGLVMIGDKFDFRAFTTEEKQLCQEVRLLLFLGSASYSSTMERGPNTGHYVATSENFSLIEQNFEFDGQYTSVRDGYIIEKLIGGYKVGEITFPTPDYTPNPISFRHDVKLISNMLRLRKTQKRMYRRIMRATELLMQSYYNDTKLSQPARILTMAAAYETLFELPETGQRKKLKAEFERMFAHKGDPMVTFISHYEKGKAVKVRKSVKVYWADRFYQLRNSIIHGSPMKPSDYVFRGVQRHFDIAVLFFVLAIKQMIGEKPGIKPTHDFIKWDKNGGKDDADDVEYEGFIYDKGDLREAIHEAFAKTRKK